MCAFTGNSTTPTQPEHDAAFSPSPRREGILQLGRLGIFYTWHAETEQAEIEDIKLAPETKPAHLWRNNDSGCRFIAAIHAVLTAQGSSFSELIAEHRKQDQEIEVV